MTAILHLLLQTTKKYKSCTGAEYLIVNIFHIPSKISKTFCNVKNIKVYSNYMTKTT